MKRRNKPALLLGALLCAMAGAASADRADRDKPVHLEANQVTLDDVRQVGIFIGDVVITQGTLTITGDQVETRQGPGGFERGIVTGKLASFRQKREGRSEYVEGYGARIEYNAVTGIMDLYGQARVKQGQDEVRGDHITYDARKETFHAVGGPLLQKDGKVHVVINPTRPAAPVSAVPPADSLPIKPDTRLLPPENNP